MYVVKNMFIGIGTPVQYIANGLSAMSIGITMLLTIFVIYLGPLLLVDYLTHRELIEGHTMTTDTGKRIVTVAYYLILSILIIMYSPKGIATEFVYFQF